MESGALPEQLTQSPAAVGSFCVSTEVTVNHIAPQRTTTPKVLNVLKVLKVRDTIPPLRKDFQSGRLARQTNENNDISQIEGKLFAANSFVQLVSQTTSW